MGWPALTTEPMARPRPRKRGLTVAGSILVLLGLLVGVTSGVRVSLLIGKPLSQTLTSPERKTPLNDSIMLTKGTYVVFELTGQTPANNDTGLPQTTIPQVTLGSVRVTGPDGRRVPVTGPGSATQTLTRQQAVYTGEAFFTATTSGTYRVKVAPKHATRVVIGPTIGSGLEEGAPWLLAAVASFIGLVVGLVFLIVGRRRRRGPRDRHPDGRERRPSGSASPAALPPPGWYTDPSAAGRMRYWDGKGWINTAR